MISVLDLSPVLARMLLADVAVLSTIRAGKSPRIKRAPRQVREGLSYVAHTPELRAPLLTLALIATLAFTMQVSVPTLVHKSFAGGPSQLGAALTTLAGLAIVGLGWSYFLGTTIATLQSADPRMLGRVMSLFALVLLGGTSGGAPVASSLSGSLGPRAPFFAGTAAAIAALAIAAGSVRTCPQPDREERAAVLIKEGDA